ncbi:adenylate/guanylate cyclase domain-containing protein [Candidatus Bipolaricaulota bacterium]|nr:adenylate/guanylate cyclase domain-containing protein [Candidatus Bipolaricaulota bacterium]
MARKDERTVLFSDIRDFTTLTARKGDREAFKLVKRFIGLIEDQVEQYDGNLVKTYGDGALTTFPAGENGFRASIGMQRSLSEHNEANPDDTITIGVGLNHGETIREDGDVFGHAVNVAARLGNYAKGGQIIVSSDCKKAEEPTESEEFNFLDLGPKTLKGIGEQRIYELLWREEVGRLKTKDDELVIVLTEDELAIELSKDINEELARAREEVRREAENSSGFTRFILKKIEGFLDNQVSGFLNKLLRKKGIGLQHEIEDVRLEIQEDYLSFSVSGEEILTLPREKIESSVAEDFVEKFNTLRDS